MRAMNSLRATTWALSARMNAGYEQLPFEARPKCVLALRMLIKHEKKTFFS
jgi:hypothetical protein